MKIALVVLILVVLAIAVFFTHFSEPAKVGVSKIANEQKKAQKPLLKYTFENLSKTSFDASKIEIGDVLQQDAAFTSYKFYFWVDGKKVSGLLNVPKVTGTYPVIVMFRGYVDKEIYNTGVGTQRAGEVFAKNGFITLAPDFLGYGESDMPSDDSFEERFQTYTTVQTLFKSVSNLNDAFDYLCHSRLAAEGEPRFQRDRESDPRFREDDSVCDIRVDPNKVGIWGHSNGGQIALSTLEISQKPYPTVLWAPVSKPFPYSILYYTDEFDDKGKALRKALANFEDNYDVELYNLANYFDKSNAPIQLHQGTADEEVPQKWSDDLVANLKKLDKKVEYFTYPGANHNMTPGWDIAVSRSVEFFKQKL